MTQITNEDCFDLLARLPDKSIDLVLIDPPYVISRKTNFASGEAKGQDTDRFRVSMNFGEWDKSENNNLSQVIQECYRILKNSGTIICFYDLWKITLLQQYYIQAGFTQLRYIEWIKTNPVPLNSKVNYLTNAREIAITGVKKNKPVFNSSYDNGIYQYPICHSKDRFHPTQKPLELIKSLVAKHSNKGDTVLDCFLGSGTTAVAAQQLERNFIGCEIDKEYYQKSLRRIDLSFFS